MLSVPSGALLLALTLPSPLHAATLEEIAQLRYLANSNRRADALQLGAELLEEDPSDLSLHITWMQLRARSGQDDARQLEGVYRAWLSEAPEDPLRRAATAWAVGLAAPGGEHGNIPGRSGPWCDEVLGLLVPLPEEGAQRARALWLERYTRARCGLDDSESRAALMAIAEEQPRVRYATVELRLGDEVVEEEDAAAVAALLEGDPWRAGQLGRLWRDGMTGEGLEQAREHAITMARDALDSDDRALLEAAFWVLRSAELGDDLERCRQRLAELDPELRLPGPLTHSHGAPEPAAILDPTQRLAALDARKNDLERRERGAWHSERAAVLEALDRRGEALDERRLAYRRSYGYASNLAYAEAALALDAQLREARKALDVAVSNHEDIRSVGLDWSATRESHRENLSRALELRAELHRRLGGDERARVDASRALLLTDSTAAHLVLGLVTRSNKRLEGTAFQHLATGLARGGSGLERLDREARTALEEDWDAQGWWSPGGLESWLQGIASSEDPHATLQAAPEPDPFPDLELLIDGEERLLSSIEGPVVVDLWATWCGPCRLALPQLDLLARRHPEVTFLAVSVDDEPSDPGAYLSESTPAFVTAWAGPEAMKAAGVSGIPAVFFLDARHRVVATERGWSPGGSGLEQGMAALEAAQRDRGGEGAR